MKISLAEVFANEGVKKFFEFDEFPKEDRFEFNGEELRLLKPLQVSGYIIRYEEKISLQMSIKTSIQRICSRCLTAFEESIDIMANFTFGKDNKDADNDLIPIYGDSIVIDEIVLDEVLSQISMKPLCNTDCNGLCPICGTNKNFGQCDCVIEEVDPRLEILKSLLEKE